MAMFSKKYFTAFNEVAAHDVKWGAHEIYYADIDAWDGGPSFEKNHFVGVPTLCLRYGKLTFFPAGLWSSLSSQSHCGGDL